MGRVSRCDKLFLFTALSGALFVATQFKCATLGFRQLTKGPSFQDQRGFFSVLRWAESLHSPHDLDVLVRMMKQSTLTEPTHPNGATRKGSNTTSKSSTDPNGGDEPLYIQLAHMAAFETYVHVSKLLLQCGLVLFLHRAQVLSRRQAMAPICLCALVLLCWKMAQTCLQELFAPRKPLKTSQHDDKSGHAMEMKAAFLSTLFLLRFAGTTLVNLAMGRAYQRYLCEPWPATWKRVPRYLGSKNLILATLFYAAGCVAAMSVSCTALRSLSEAALQFESAALACSLLHLVLFQFASEQSQPKQV